MEAQIGRALILKKFIKTMDEYKTKEEVLVDQDENSNKTYNLATIAAEQKCIKKAANILYAYIYIENADPDKYRSVLKTLNQQKLFGNNQFPKTIIEANAILSNHNYEMSKNRNNERNANKTEGIKN